MRRGAGANETRRAPFFNRNKSIGRACSGADRRVGMVYSTEFLFVRRCSAQKLWMEAVNKRVFLEVGIDGDGDSPLGILDA